VTDHAPARGHLARHTHRRTRSGAAGAPRLRGAPTAPAAVRWRYPHTPRPGGPEAPDAERGPHAHKATHRRTRRSFGYFEPSLQSALHPSIGLLVCYRSRASDQPYDGYTSHFKR